MEWRKAMESEKIGRRRTEKSDEMFKTLEYGPELRCR